MAEENLGWGYDRIVGALSNLGYEVSDETVGNILKRHGISPAPNRKPNLPWSDFIARHQDVITACDFFTTEVFTPAGLVTFYVLFFIQLESRKVHIAGITPHPNQAWMNQIAKNLTMDEWGFLQGQRYLILDRDTKFCENFRRVIRDSGIKCIRLPPNSPNMNAYAERFVRTIKDECLSRLILFGESSLRQVLKEFISHYHEERNHQGKGNLLLFSEPVDQPSEGTVQCKQRLGGLLKFYHRQAA